MYVFRFLHYFVIFSTLNWESKLLCKVKRMLIKVKGHQGQFQRSLVQWCHHNTMVFYYNSNTMYVNTAQVMLSTPPLKIKSRNEKFNIFNKK